MRHPRPAHVDTDRTVVSLRPDLDDEPPSDTNSNDRTALIRHVALALDDDDSLPPAHVSMLDLSDLGSLPNITVMDQPTRTGLPMQPLPARALPKTAANQMTGKSSSSQPLVRWNEDGDHEPTAVTEVMPSMLRAIVSAELTVIVEEVSAAARQDPGLAVTLRRLRSLQERFRASD